MKEIKQTITLEMKNLKKVKIEFVFFFFHFFEFKENVILWKIFTNKQLCSVIALKKILQYWLRLSQKLHENEILKVF